MLLTRRPLFCSLLWAARSALLVTGYSLHDRSSEDFNAVSGIEAREPLVKPRQIVDTVNFNPNGSAYLWIPSEEDKYVGKTFFDQWDFFSEQDLTKYVLALRDVVTAADGRFLFSGMVNYVNRDTAFKDGLVYVQDNGVVIIKADDKTQLRRGEHRKSVRISSKKRYSSGNLFILDLERAPWGCAVWPAFWTVGPGWPWSGEIDILEGVHDNMANQIAFHTSPGCWLNANRSNEFTGAIKKDGAGGLRTHCDRTRGDGCGITEWSQASFGPYLVEQGGGVLAMKWDENDISIWSFFRAAIPKDITQGAPDPRQWGLPSVKLHNETCNINQYFKDHTIVINLTFCGDWAGATYQSTNCPGTCAERMMDPANFANASFAIRSLKVYKKTTIVGNSTTVASAAESHLLGGVWQVRMWTMWSVVLGLMMRRVLVML